MTGRARARVLSIVGTRPEAIKMAPVIRALSEHDALRAAVWLTDQHQEMLGQVLDVFGLAADQRLGPAARTRSLARMTARLVTGLGRLLARERPAAVLVQGDTTSALAGALAAFYSGVPLGHVEAGLRTRRKDAPFPEEANRRLISVLADWHYAPTEWARRNLLAEGFADESIVVTGNTVIDALRSIDPTRFDPDPAAGAALASAERLILVTAHRRENHGAPLRDLCAALRSLAERNPDVALAFPVHPNPRVREPVHRRLGGHPRIHLLAPLDYLGFVGLLRRCHFVITDSGGIQEEAPAFGKPVLVLRDTTERPEGVEAGTARLVGTERGRIVAEAERLLRDAAAYDAMARAHHPYGDGDSARRIAAHVAESLRALPPSAGGGVQARRAVVDEQPLDAKRGRVGAAVDPLEDQIQRHRTGAP
jgi:UDP-N-acetylglucosamine 2-epimerase (non-hydrolysing)